MVTPLTAGPRTQPPPPVQSAGPQIAPDPAVAPAKVPLPDDAPFPPVKDGPGPVCPENTPFSPTGDTCFPDKSGNQLPTEKITGERKSELQRGLDEGRQLTASYRVGQDQAHDRLDSRLADQNFSLPQAVKGAQDALAALNVPEQDRQKIQQSMDQLLGKLPEALQREAAVYLEQLFSARGQALGPETLAAVLGKISEMADQPYDARVGDPKSFAVSALRDIAVPESIFQGKTMACASASVQVQLSLTDPMRYLNMADTLAQGKAFEGMEPNWSFTRETEASTDTQRSITARLMQNTIMEVGRDIEGEVLNTTNRPGVEDFDSSIPQGIVKVVEGRPTPGAGLTKAEKERLSGGTDELAGVYLESKVLGRDLPVLYHSGIKDGQAEYAESDVVHNVPKSELVDILRQAEPSRSNPIRISFQSSESGLHSMTAIGIDEEAVYVINSASGGIDRIPLEDFGGRVVGVYVPGD